MILISQFAVFKLTGLSFRKESYLHCVFPGRLDCGCSGTLSFFVCHMLLQILL